MREQTTMSVGIAIVLNEVSRMLLYKKTTNEQGQEFLVDREIPFRLKYRLNKNRMMLENDVKRFNQMRMIALAKYGEATPDGQNVVITDPEKKQKFQEEVSALVDAQVTHPLNLLDPTDFELINDTDMPISPEAMSIFTAYLVDDPDFEKDIKLGVSFRDYEGEKASDLPAETAPDLPAVEEVKTEAAVEEKPVAKKATKPRKKTTPKTETVVEEKPTEVVEEKPAVKKTTVKKTTTAKKTEGETKTTAKKSTTTKKKTTKKEETNG